MFIKCYVTDHNESGKIVTIYPHFAKFSNSYDKELYQILNDCDQHT